MASLIEAGIYSGSIAQAVATTSKKGDPMIVVEFDVNHVANGSDWAEIAPARRSVFISLSEKAWPYSKDKLVRLGFNGNFDEPRFSAGVGVELECKHEIYEGRGGEKWELAGGSKEWEPIKPDQSRLWAAKWKAETAPPPAKPAGRPAAPPRPAAPERVAAAVDESGIPF